jgi:hypothetical protein
MDRSPAGPNGIRSCRNRARSRRPRLLTGAARWPARVETAAKSIQAIQAAGKGVEPTPVPEPGAGVDVLGRQTPAMSKQRWGTSHPPLSQNAEDDLLRPHCRVHPHRLALDLLRVARVARRQRMLRSLHKIRSPTRASSQSLLYSTQGPLCMMWISHRPAARRLSNTWGEP